MELVDEIIEQILTTIVSKTPIKKKNIWQVKVIKGGLNTAIFMSFRFTAENNLKYLLSLTIDLNDRIALAGYRISQLCHRRHYTKTLVHYSIELPKTALMPSAIATPAIRDYYTLNKFFPPFLLVRSFDKYLKPELVIALSEIKNKSDLWEKELQ